MVGRNYWSQKTANFKNDLATGHDGELRVAQVLGTELGAITRDSGDLMAQTLLGMVPLEIKNDVAYNKTGNIAMEMADVFSNHMVGTGVGKQALIGVPSVNCHLLGDSGQVLVYEAITTLRQMAAEPLDMFHKLVTVRNNVYHTVSGLMRPPELTGGTIIALSDLKEFLAEYEPQWDFICDENFIKGVIIETITAHGLIDDSNFFHHKFAIKEDKEMLALKEAAEASALSRPRISHRPPARI
jgi:hypothetical protein